MGAAYKLYFLFLLCQASANKPRKGTTLHDVWNDLVLQTSNTASARCNSCEQNRNFIESALTEYEMKHMRIEIVKQTILNQLGMSKAPKIDVPLSKIPFPIREGFLTDQQLAQVQLPKQTSDKVIIISSDVDCFTEENRFKIFLKFNTSNNLEDEARAKLWLHTDKYKLNSCIISLNPCENENGGHYYKIVQEKDVRTTDGWSELDIGTVLGENRGTNAEELCYIGTIECNGTQGYKVDEICDIFLPNETSTKPFILVDVKTEVGINRGKRNINCTKGATDCCRENLYVSFVDIGWGSWIISPSGYNAYYCKGNCANAATISLSSTPYHSVIRKLYHYSLSKGLPLDVTPCCTPRDLSGVQLIYMDENQGLHSKVIPNLSVNTCGCM